MLNIDEIKNTIICGDCLEVMKQLPDKCVDLVLTDIPYGIGIHNMNFVKSGAKKIGKAYRNDYTETGDWDVKPQQECIQEILRMSLNQIIFGGEHIQHYVESSRGWIIWDKRIDDKYKNDFADCELAWTSFKKPARIFHYLWSGFLRGDNSVFEERFHPAQKPVALMQWCLENYSKEGDTILDPFLGSGTTAVACYRTRRNYIGIEISPEYCKIAEKRIQQEKDKLALFNGLEAS